MPELGDAPARRGERAVATIERTSALCARGARDRGADQADADQREAIEERRLASHDFFPTNSANAATTSRFASSLPTVMRSAFGR